MRGSALICNTQGSSADECTLYFFNKIERFPIDSEFGLLMMLELINKGNITNKHFFIYERKAPCMICFNYYDTFLQKYPSVSIDVYFSKFYTIDKKDLLNGIYETSNSRVYGSKPKKWYEKDDLVLQIYTSVNPRGGFRTVNSSNKNAFSAGIEWLLWAIYDKMPLIWELFSIFPTKSGNKLQTKRKNR